MVKISMDVFLYVDKMACAVVSCKVPFQISREFQNLQDGFPIQPDRDGPSRLQNEE